MPVALFAMILALQASPSLSPDAIARIAPVAAAIKSVQEAQSRLPPPASEGEALVRMVDVEQAGRRAPEATQAAFLTVQHADLDLWQRFVPVLEPLVAKGEVKGTEYALMFDRLALKEGRPQRYGSQLTCKDGKFVVDTLEDPDHVDERRKAMGFDTTLAENVQRFADLPPCS